jgi:hypothetical protein
MKYTALFALFALFAFGFLGCPAPREGLNPADLPPAVRADYGVFAQRCSKCHSLARPLDSGIVDNAFWVNYVARMRRQPGSGISKEDEQVILRFLFFFSAEERRKKEATNEGLARGDSGAQ